MKKATMMIALAGLLMLSGCSYVDQSVNFIEDNALSDNLTEHYLRSEQARICVAINAPAYAYRVWNACPLPGTLPTSGDWYMSFVDSGINRGLLPASIVFTPPSLAAYLRNEEAWRVDDPLLAYRWKLGTKVDLVEFVVDKNSVHNASCLEPNLLEIRLLPANQPIQVVKVLKKDQLTQVKLSLKSNKGRRIDAWVDTKDIQSLSGGHGDFAWANQHFAACL